MLRKCNAYKALIAPFLNRKYLEGFNSALRDNKITKVLPLCYPIPDSSPASSSVVVVLAIQHVMTALQEEQSVSKRQPKESVVSANILLTTRVTTPSIFAPSNFTRLYFGPFSIYPYIFDKIFFEEFQQKTKKFDRKESLKIKLGIYKRREAQFFSARL